MWIVDHGCLVGRMEVAGVASYSEGVKCKRAVPSPRTMHRDVFLDAHYELSSCPGDGGEPVEDFRVRHLLMCRVCGLALLADV